MGSGDDEGAGADEVAHVAVDLGPVGGVVGDAAGVLEVLCVTRLVEEFFMTVPGSWVLLTLV